MQRMDRNRIGRLETLCSTCGKACNSGCAWSDEFDPVPGWKAVRTLNSYYVLDCPEYVSDVGVRRDAQSMDTEGCIQLMEAMMRMARDDYLTMPKSRKAIERFILNPAAKHLIFFAVPEDVVRKLRREADEHDRKLADAVKP